MGELEVRTPGLQRRASNVHGNSRSAQAIVKRGELTLGERICYRIHNDAMRRRRIEGMGFPLQPPKRLMTPAKRRRFFVIVGSLFYTQELEA
jgi:hypothetical protein